MALNDGFLRLEVHTAGQNARCRTIYRPRSEQFVKYIAHALKLDQEKQKDTDRGDSRDGEPDKQREEYISRRIRDIDAFERRAAGFDKRARGKRP